MIYQTDAQGLDYSIASLRGMCEKDVQQQASLSAAADAHAHSVAARDNCVRETAATCGISDLASIPTLSDADLSRWPLPVSPCDIPYVMPTRSF